MKIAVVYHSKTGNTAKMAGYVVEGLRSVAGVEAQAFGIDAVDTDFVRQSRGLIVGTPVYGGTFSGETKMWLDHGLGGVEMGGKLAGAFATAGFVHGGADAAVLSILNQLTVHGMLIYSSGISKGQPFIHFGPVALAGDLDSSIELFTIYGRRMAEKAKELYEYPVTL